MTTFAVQYLESPYPDATPGAVRLRLRQACERLPINIVLLGWELSPALEEVVAEETVRQHAQLYRWQPILTGDAHTDLPPEWATLGSRWSSHPRPRQPAGVYFHMPEPQRSRRFLIGTAGERGGFRAVPGNIPGPHPLPLPCHRSWARSGLFLPRLYPPGSRCRTGP